MNGASKILTVSYGTFSCTLEGFDDPFNTMKAIAEYFRDLAAEDRYFGAEPPTPDAAMLHKIAEREIQRRVEAKIADNSVILRAEEGVTPKVTFPASPPAAPAPQIAPQPAPVLASPAEAAPAIESAAARLSRLRAAQAHLAAPAVVVPLPVAAPVAFDLPEDEDSSAIAAAFPEVVADRDEEAEQRRAAKEARRARKAAEKAVEPAPAVVETAVQSAAEPEDFLASVALAVAETRPAPVEDIAADHIAEEDLSLDAIPEEATPEELAAAELPPEEPEVDLDGLAASIRETLAGLGGADQQLAISMSETAAEADAGLAAAIDTLIADDDQTDLDALTVLDTYEPEAEPETDLDFSDLDQPFIDEEAPAHAVAAVAELAVDEDEIGAAIQADIPVEAEASDLGTQLGEPKGAPEVEISAPVVAEKIQRARARVIKIRRLDTATAAEMATPAEPTADAAEAPALSAEAEDALAAELAALQQELGAPEAAPELTAEAASRPATPVVPTRVIRANAEISAIAAEIRPQPAFDTPAAPQEPHRLPAAETDDASVNRLLEKANTELEVPETKRRRSAIAHLKAAVLATVAERRANPNKAPDTQRMDPYRKDLDQVVRPMTTERPAPLVLVSSQRIDRAPGAGSSAAMSQPIRPRRIATRLTGQAVPSSLLDDDEDGEPMGNVFIDPSKQSFQEFAEALGAQSLQDLIEAAGAYCTIVLGHDSFTRPFLFQQIGTLPGHSDTSREDGLRGFGRLLREGRMTKTKRGQYALTEISPMLSEAKRQAS